ncbi:MAG TPA: hypothetical protein VI542_26790 [Candidatus Tectomicrobia bacterium]
MEQREKATNAEVGEIIFTLSDARKRLHSDNFLNETCPGKGDGFPWSKIKWYKANTNHQDLENLYLFWNGVAWGEGDTPPRRLKQGTKEFMDMNGNIYKPNFEHISDILNKRDSYRAGHQDQDSKGGKRRFLILVARNFNDSPFMILDGNHRAVAGLWWHYEEKEKEIKHLPETVRCEP